MEVLVSPIQKCCDGDLDQYWRDVQSEENIYIESPIANLIRRQFEDLKSRNLGAYHLLIRMGCFRFQQEMPTVPEEILSRLLWDVPKLTQKKSIRFLRDAGLVKFREKGFRLHPLIREEARERLKNSSDWEHTNRVAAEFWSKIERIRFKEDAFFALEAYYHYYAIDNYRQALSIICNRRTTKSLNPFSENSIQGPTLGGDFIRLGIHQPIKVSLENLIHKDIHDNHLLSKSYNLLGDIYCFNGNIREGIECHQKSGEITNNMLNSYGRSKIIQERGEAAFYEIQVLSIVYLFNIGIHKVDLGDFESGLGYLEEVIEVTQGLPELHGYRIRAYANLASLYSEINELNKAREMILILEESILSIQIGVRSTLYRFYHLGKAFFRLGNLVKSQKYYLYGQRYSDEIKFRQGSGLSMMGLARIDRAQKQYDLALNKLQQSLDIFDRIGAKCDLAEAHYQRALTYQEMNDPRCQADFTKALELWGPNHIDAPKQIARVCASMKTPL